MLCERRPALGVVAFGGAMTQRPRFVERLVDALVVRAGFEVVSNPAGDQETCGAGEAVLFGRRGRTSSRIT